jgi:hypothetical protein
MTFLLFGFFFLCSFFLEKLHTQDYVMTIVDFWSYSQTWFWIALPILGFSQLGCYGLN